MTKRIILWIILDLIFLAIFNAMFFILGGREHNLSVWISYCFIHFAYLLLILTPILTRRGKSAALFGISIFTISTIYFFAELVVGVVFILVSPDDFKAALLVQLCLAGIYGIILIAVLIANERTAEAERKRKHEIAFVKDASARLKVLLDRISDKEAKKKVEKVYDVIYSSPVKSHPSLAQMENSILQSLYELENEIYAGNSEGVITLADSLFDNISERNIRLKTLN